MYKVTLNNQTILETSDLEKARECMRDNSGAVIHYGKAAIDQINAEREKAHKAAHVSPVKNPRKTSNNAPLFNPVKWSFYFDHSDTVETCPDTIN